VLVSTVGVEPGTRLRAVELAVLNDDFAVIASRSTARASDRSDVTDLPVTRYVDVGGSAVAYQVWGTGPLDIVLVPQLVCHLEAMLDLPGYRAWIEGLASIGTLLVFDKRGNGLSDRLVCALTIDERIADIAAVMDAAGMPRAALVGTSEGGTLALRFAAAHPDRVTCVVAAGATAAGRYATGRISEDAHKDMVRRIRETWGTGQDWWMYELAAPSLRHAPLAVRRHYEQMNRMSSSPTTAAFLWDLYGRMDIRPLLSDVRCPVLVQHRVAESLAWASADLLEGLPHAEQALVPGSDHPVWVGDVDAYLAPIRTFLANHAPPAR
jgi:pimeloyl-ACP methyl ester carboxylesterase